MAWKFAEKLFKFLKPPELDDNDELEGADLVYKHQVNARRRRRWEWRIFGAVLVIFGLISADQALQWGLVPTVFHGFAHAEDMKEQAKAIDDLSQLVRQQLAQSVAKDIRLLVAKRCRETNPAERDRLYEEIDKLQREYQSLNEKRERYAAPSCSEV